MDQSILGSLKAHWIVTLGTLYIIHQLGTIIYNLFFHPLAHVPGPFLGRSTLLWRFWDSVSGLHHIHLRDLHAKYGHVVRVGPNELSFSTMQSYRDIYGYPPPGAQQCIKTEMYDVIGSGFEVPDIASERDPEAHARKKKLLTPAFSTKALVAQESIIHRCLGAFVAKIGPVSQRSAEEGMNMVPWFEMSAFDLFGEMSFGESFGCIAEENHHFWIDMVLHHMREVVIMDNLRRFDLLQLFFKKLLPKLTMSVLAKHTRYTRDKIQGRLDRESPRQDFFTNMVSKVKAGDVPFEEMAATASSLIIAGGETTATTSAAVLYFLLKTPHALAKVNAEVRGRWASYADIDAGSAQQLPYLQAVINEGLRMYPSGAQGFPRLSPGATIDGLWVPKGTEIYTCTWVASRNPDYWRQPNEFVPERWTDPDSKDLKAASMPFSLGFRACPGKNFAMLQLSLVFAKILYTYDLELLDPEMDWEAKSLHWIMWWKPPIRIRAHNRLDESLNSK